MLAPVLTQPAEEAPVTLEDVKVHCRVDHSEDDTLLEGLMGAATAHLDGWAGVLGRALVTQTWSQRFSGFTDRLRLPVGPVVSVSSLTYFDGDNVQQTLSTSVYDLLHDALGAYVARKPGQTWPGAYDRPDAITVTYVSGADAAEVPAPIKAAILLLVGHWYANREAVSAEAMKDLPLAVDSLVRPYRRIGV